MVPSWSQLEVKRRRGRRTWQAKLLAGGRVKQTGGVPDREPEKMAAMSDRQPGNRDAYGYREGATAIVLTPSRGQMLVCELRSPFVPGAVLPSGGLEPGEDVLTAGLRELQEETGIVCDQLQVVGVSQRSFRYELTDEQFDIWIARGSHFRGQQKRYVVAKLLAPTELTPPTEPAIKATKFIARSELPAVLNHPEEAIVIEQILADFGL